MIRKLVITILALGLTPLAFAQGMGMTQSFADLDTDDSGTLSKEELAKVIPEERVDRAFSRWDADENGEISEEEFDNRPPPPGMGG